MLAAAPPPASPSAWAPRETASRAPTACRARPSRRTEHSSPESGGLGITLPGLCSTLDGCSPDWAALAVESPLPSPEQWQRLAHRLAGFAAAPHTQAMAAALLAQHQLSTASQAGSSDGAGSGSSSAWHDVVWSFGSCAAHGDVWCLLQLALLCSQQAAATVSIRRRRQHYAVALRLLHQAGTAVHAAARLWDVWLRGGANAALGSFVAVCSSGTSLGDVAAQLEQVSALVTQAASEEGGAELWALQNLLQQQEERLALARSASLTQ